MMYVQTGRAPDTAKFEQRVLNPTERLIADKVTDSLKKKALEYLQKGAVILGGAAVETLFKIKGSTIGGLVIDVGWSLLSDQLAKRELKDLTSRYQIDERRRLYLATQGLSSYKQIAAL